MLGCKSGTVISRLEKGERRPSLKIALACYVIFDTPPHELFPGVFSRIENCILKRAWDLYDGIQGDPSAKTRLKLDVLQEAIERAKERSSQNSA